MLRDHSLWTPVLMVLSTCFVVRVGLASSNVTVHHQNTLTTNHTLHCWESAHLCKERNQTCNETTSLCDCPTNKPIRLSSEIPCLKAKLLGQVCLHSRECSSVPNAACFATILFPVELLSMPTYRQWNIYHHITESDELNYLLNKVYGECRCKAGYRATQPNKCVSKENETPHTCLNKTDCNLSHSYCDPREDKCRCSMGFFYDRDLNACIALGSRYEQFCVISSDCQVRDGSLQCIKSKCVCESGQRFVNESKCMPTTDCGSSGIWDKANALCESPSSLVLHSILVKIVLILLLKLIICNLVRIVCIRRRMLNSQELGRARYLDSDRQSGQSHSLLSLPPYETVFSETSVTLPPADYLPTYEEALESVRNNRGYNVLSAEKESEMA